MVKLGIPKFAHQPEPCRTRKSIQFRRNQGCVLGFRNTKGYGSTGSQVGSELSACRLGPTFPATAHRQVEHVRMG